jgi:putative transposase
MDLPVRKKLPHAVPQWVPDGSWFFLTIKCVPPGRNQLCQAGIGDAVMAALAHNHVKMVWHCRLALLMPDHLHGIFAFPPAPGMATTVKPELRSWWRQASLPDVEGGIFAARKGR